MNLELSRTEYCLMIVLLGFLMSGLYWVLMVKNCKKLIIKMQFLFPLNDLKLLVAANDRTAFARILNDYHAQMICFTEVNNVADPKNAEKKINSLICASNAVYHLAASRLNAGDSLFSVFQILADGNKTIFKLAI